MVFDVSAWKWKNFDRRMQEAEAIVWDVKGKLETAASLRELEGLGAAHRLMVEAEPFREDTSDQDRLDDLNEMINEVGKEIKQLRKGGMR